MTTLEVLPPVMARSATSAADTTGMYPRYLPSRRPAPDYRTTLREFIDKNPNYRDKAIRFVTERLTR